MKYIVNEGVSFIANGRIYKPGDEIDSLFFKFEKTFQAAIASGKLKPIPDAGTDGVSPDAGGDAGTDGVSPDAGGDDGTGGGDTGLKPKRRKAIEKAAIDNGLKSPEEIKSLSDKDLAEILMAAGVEV